jgi:hypothetical protein
MPEGPRYNEFKFKFYLDKEYQNFSTGIEIYENLGTKIVIDINILFHIIIFQKIFNSALSN